MANEGIVGPGRRLHWRSTEEALRPERGWACWAHLKVCDSEAVRQFLRSSFQHGRMRNKKSPSFGRNMRPSGGDTEAGPWPVRRGSEQALWGLRGALARSCFGALGGLRLCALGTIGALHSIATAH